MVRPSSSFKTCWTNRFSSAAQTGYNHEERCDARVTFNIALATSGAEPNPDLVEPDHNVAESKPGRYDAQSGRPTYAGLLEPNPNLVERALDWAEPKPNLAEPNPRVVSTAVR